MSAPAVFVLDSDVFIAAKNAYYAFDICPGFWQALIRGNAGGASVRHLGCRCARRAR